MQSARNGGPAAPAHDKTEFHRLTLLAINKNNPAASMKRHVAPAAAADSTDDPLLSYYENVSVRLELVRSSSPSSSSSDNDSDDDGNDPGGKDDGSALSLDAANSAAGAGGSVGGFFGRFKFGRKKCQQGEAADECSEDHSGHLHCYR